MSQLTAEPPELEDHRAIVELDDAVVDAALQVRGDDEGRA
jgi:hypothetical protein